MGALILVLLLCAPLVYHDDECGAIPEHEHAFFALVILRVGGGELEE